MNQQEFDRQCVALRAERKKAMHEIRAQRATAAHNVKMRIMALNDMKEAAVREYRDAIYDLATTSSPRSSAFVAGQAEARNKRDAKIAEAEAKIREEENDYYEACQALSRLTEDTAYKFSLRRAEILSEYTEWLEEHKAAKAAERGAVV